MEGHQTAVYARGSSADARRLMSFLEKRPPHFSDRVSTGMPAYFPWWTERQVPLNNPRARVPRGLRQGLQHPRLFHSTSAVAAAGWDQWLWRQPWKFEFEPEKMPWFVVQEGHHCLDTCDGDAPLVTSADQVTVAGHHCQMPSVRISVIEAGMHALLSSTTFRLASSVVGPHRFR